MVLNVLFRRMSPVPFSNVSQYRTINTVPLVWILLILILSEIFPSVKCCCIAMINLRHLHETIPIPEMPIVARYLYVDAFALVVSVMLPHSFRGFIFICCGHK